MFVVTPHGNRAVTNEELFSKVYGLFTCSFLCLIVVIAEAFSGLPMSGLGDGQ